MQAFGCTLSKSALIGMLRAHDHVQLRHPPQQGSPLLLGHAACQHQLDVRVSLPLAQGLHWGDA